MCMDSHPGYTFIHAKGIEGMPQTFHIKINEKGLYKKQTKHLLEVCHFDLKHTGIAADDYSNWSDTADFWSLKKKFLVPT